MSNFRVKNNQARAKAQWLEQSPKFVLEFFVVLVGLVLFIFATIPSNLILASSTLIIFGLAITRLSPSLLRTQMGVTLFKHYGARFYETEILLNEIYSNQRAVKSFSQINVDNSSIKIELKEVSFRYPDSKVILNNYSSIFTIGKVNCVIGDSGAGKSTFADILLGLISQNSGEVLINGIDREQWRVNFPHKIYYIPQEGIIFPGSIIENVAFKNKLTGPELVKIEKILRNVGWFDTSTEISNLEQDLQSGSFLSGGEKQRIILARAIFSDAQIILLDEPTAAMDTVSERKIFELLDFISKERLVILITHSELAKQMFQEVTVIG
jgi:ATP-binding cassette subfamily C protein